MYVIVACVVYSLSGQYVVSPALGSAPGVASKAAYGILFPTLLGSGLVFGHTGIKYMYNVVMDKVIKTRHRLTDNTFLTWGVWLGTGTLFWVMAFVLANAIPVFGSILAISSALFVTWVGGRVFFFRCASVLIGSAVHLRYGQRAVGLPELGQPVHQLEEDLARIVQLVHDLG
jgi:hypothetical protein